MSLQLAYHLQAVNERLNKMSYQNSIAERSPFLSAIRGSERVIGLYEREFIVDQVYRAIREFYVHLPIKRSSMGVDPLQELRVLRDAVRFIEGDLSLYARLRNILRKLRDRHTNLILPPPWTNATAFLPIALESVWLNGRRIVMVTQSFGEYEAHGVTKGSILTHWNGIEIGRYIEALANETLGANPFARIALAIRSLTSRALAHDTWPIEDWVTLTFERNGNPVSVPAPWRVYNPDVVPLVSSFVDQGHASTTTGWDEQLAEVNKSWLSLFSATDIDLTRASSFESNFLCSRRTFGKESVGYLRIFSFESDDPLRFVEHVKGKIDELDVPTLIVDVRGNPGGNILCGEGVLQLLVARHIDPAPVSFRNTDAIRRICSSNPMFDEWRYSTVASIDTGEVFSQGMQISPREYLSDLQPSFSGKVALIVDGLSYSTTDFLAAGFRDHARGAIVGVDPMMGAGGANVWNHDIIAGFSHASGVIGVEKLPFGLSMNVAVRRSTGTSAFEDLPVENFGAAPNKTYQMSVDDALGNNERLIEFVSRELMFL